MIRLLLYASWHISSLSFRLYVKLSMNRNIYKYKSVYILRKALQFIYFLINVINNSIITIGTEHFILCHIQYDLSWCMKLHATTKINNNLQMISETNQLCLWLESCYTTKGKILFLNTIQSYLFILFANVYIVSSWLEKHFQVIFPSNGIVGISLWRI